MLDYIKKNVSKFSGKGVSVGGGEIRAVKAMGNFDEIPEAIRKAFIYRWILRYGLRFVRHLDRGHDLGADRHVGRRYRRRVGHGRHVDRADGLHRQNCDGRRHRCGRCLQI